MKKRLPTAQQIVQRTYEAVRAPFGFEKEAGNCKRFVRQICESLPIPAELCPPPVLDAKQCAAWYRKNHPEVCHNNGSVPGDILFYEKNSLPHGHVVVRLPGNIAGENSVAHAPEGEPDGRGYRPLLRVGEPTLIVRLWK